MMSATLFLAVLFSAITLWSPSHSVRDVYIWEVQLRMQRKLKSLCRELILDADMKIKAVQHYRDQYYKSLQYQLGDIIYKLRDQYKQMVKTYQLVDRNMSYGHWDHNGNVKTYVKVREMAVYLETHVYMVKEWEFKRSTAEAHHNNMKDPLRGGAGRDYDASEELLRDVLARGRNALLRQARGARARRGRPPPPRAPAGPVRRKNNKWQYVRGLV